MTPLIGQLTRADRNRINRPDRADLGTVKGISAFAGLVMDCGEVGIDRQARVPMRLETLKLRMVGVPARLAAKDSPGQQRLTPKRNQTLRVEVLGIQ